MRAVRVREYGEQPSIEDVPEPSIGHPLDVIVKVDAAGVCRTDLHIIEGQWADKSGVTLPYTIGHYFATQKQAKPSTTHAEFKKVEADIASLTKRLLTIEGKRTVTSFHRELGKIMWDDCGMARSKQSLKRGGGRAHLDVDALEVAVPEPREDLLALDAALTKLATIDPAAANLVQLRYFAGLTLPEAAQTLGISPRTAGRLWAYARAWLRREIAGAGENS